MHNCDYILINGSEESGIDVLRAKNQKLCIYSFTWWWKQSSYS